MEGYLQHHGVLGMKWGVRRYQNEDGTLTALGQKRYGRMEREQQKVKDSKSSLMKQYHAKNASEMNYELERANKVKAAKGLGNKYSEAFGYGNAATKMKNAAKGEKEAGKYAKTQWGRRLRDVRSYNAKQLADYYSSMKNASLGEKITERMLGNKLMNVSVKSTAGRQSTYGKEIVVGMLTLGWGNLAMDAVYRVQHRNDYKK